MFLRILKKDIKRKKTVNLILVLFVILATMFVSSGINNVITVANGTDYYLDLAGVGDWVVITLGEDAAATTDEMLKNTKEIDDYRIEDVVFGSKDNLKTVDGEDIETKNTLILQSLENSGIKFFDENNNEPSPLAKGHIYVTGRFLKNNGLNVGDTVVIKMSDVKLTLIIDGALKDALLGSDFMGNTRFLLNSEDMETLTNDEAISQHFKGQILYIDTKDVDAIEAASTHIKGTVFNKDSSIIKTAYVMDMIVAFITLILSVCLIIVSFVVLKFTISFTITEEYREIGVMKAIGIGNFKIRSLYLTKYLIIALMGALVGLVLSFPFGKLLIKSVSENMVLGNTLGVIPNIVGAVLVVIAIVGFAYIATGKVKKATPVDAIRSGQTGERFKKKTAIKLSRSKANAPSFMAINDILSSPKRYTTIMVAFALCTLFVLVLVNTVSTMRSDALITTFASRSDLYFNTPDAMFTFMLEDGEEQMEEYLKEVQNNLNDWGMPGRVFVDAQYSYKVLSNGKEYSLTAQQGINTTMDMYEYTEGTVPRSKYEIAVTPIIADKINAHIGDTVTIDFGDTKLDCTVVAYFQSMNQLGEIIRIHEDAPTNMKDCSTLFAFQIKFDDNPSAKEILERKAKLEDKGEYDDLMTATEYQVDCMAVVPTMELVQYLLLAITLVVVALVTILMERSFIADERNEIAILKALGFKNIKIIWWQVCRFGIVSLVAAIVAGLLSIPMTKLCISPIFGMMGATNVDYVINPLKVFIMFPGIIVALTLVVTFFVALNTNTIKAKDTASIE